MPCMSVLLLAGVASDSVSMSRYARELFAALNELPGPRRAVAIEQPEQPRRLSRLIDHRETRRVDSAWFRYISYPRAVRARRADVFHILDHGYAQLIQGLDPQRTVVTCHDLIPLLAAERVIPVDIPATAARTFRRRMVHLARARRVITGSHATKATLERYTAVRGDQIVVIPYGVNPVFRPVAGVRAMRRRSAGLDDSVCVILQVATAVRYKNTPVLLRALAELRTRIERVVLVRIGAPPFPDETDLAARLRVASSITCLGRVEDRTLAEWYNAADVLAFPSLWEGFGWPTLEAMACGTPVVAADIAPVAEVVNDAAMLVPPQDPSAIARAIERVLTDPALAQALREKGLARAAQYSWRRTAACTAAVYDDLLRS